ncbi:MAG TPA: hypothetical protein VM597_13925 [Gemmataceae bacterium]|jgi:hypothetical protein|nr:hypothetical protein [Gemmataceae bacterium]
MNVRLVPALALVALAGCSKFHVEKQYTLDMFSTQHIEVTAPTSEQRIKVTMTSDEPVTVTVLLAKDVPTKEEFDPGTLDKGTLAQKKDTKDTTLDVTIPAKEKYRVYLSGAKKKAQVSVKIDEQ